jgi:hypothetical protein
VAGASLKGWKIALTVGPLLLMRALAGTAGRNPLFIGLVVLWIAFVAVTWMSVPIADLALRLSPVGRVVLPRSRSTRPPRSSRSWVAAVVAVVLALAVSTGFVLTAFTAGLLGRVARTRQLGARRRPQAEPGGLRGRDHGRLAAFVGGALIAVRVGHVSLGGILLVAALLSAVVLI